MSDARTPRLPFIALGCAVVAVVVAVVAAVHVLTRRSAAPATNATIEERHVDASDVYKLIGAVDVVVDAGQARGVRPKDAVLARTLGLGDDDAIIALSGRSTLRENDVTQFLTRASMLEVRSLFVDLQDARSARRLVRWILDGDLFDARLKAQRPSTASPVPVVPPLDIEKLDATHYRVSRMMLHMWLQAPVATLTGTRITPDPKRGFTLQSIRPGSIFDRLGAQPGDAITALNGERVTRIDDVLAWFNNAKRGPEITVDIVRSDGTPATIHIAIH
jgi:hypothetical protein